jgi:uncharacterized membrane protein YeaQ/YmgE (transglycosylase-associated protein family)
MSIIGWILLGLISGFIASKIVNKSGEGFFLDIILGIVGAIVGGFIFTAVGASGITGFNIYSMVVAVIGAIVVLVIYHAVAGPTGVLNRERRHGRCPKAICVGEKRVGSPSFGIVGMIGWLQLQSCHWDMPVNSMRLGW